MEALLRQAQPAVFAAGLDENTANFLRVASISIAVYEYVSPQQTQATTNISVCVSFLITLPAEWRFYSTQQRLSRPR